MDDAELTNKDRDPFRWTSKRTATGRQAETEPTDDTWVSFRRESKLTETGHQPEAATFFSDETQALTEGTGPAVCRQEAEMAWPECEFSCQRIIVGRRVAGNWIDGSLEDDLDVGVVPNVRRKGLAAGQSP